MVPTKYRFKNRNAEEDSLLDIITTEILQDTEIRAEMDEIHKKNKKGAVVSTFKHGEPIDLRVQDEDSILTWLPLREVHTRLQNYAPEDNICFILVRDKTASAFVVNHQLLNQNKTAGFCIF